MTDYTTKLTAREIARKEMIRPIGSMQRANLEAALRSGDRIGTSVGQVRGAPKNPVGKPYNVGLCAFRLGKNGQPVGGAKMTELATGLSECEAVAFLDAYTGKGAE